MEPSHALQGLIEAAELVKMLEDLCSPGTFEKISSGSMGGMRVTLRGVRKGILQSHDVLATKMIQQARQSGASLNVEKIVSEKPQVDSNGTSKKYDDSEKGRALRQSMEELR